MRIIRTRNICTRRTRSSLRARPLLTLPEEVILLILKFLPAKDLTNLRLVSRNLSESYFLDKAIAMKRNNHGLALYYDCKICVHDRWNPLSWTSMRAR